MDLYTIGDLMMWPFNAGAASSAVATAAAATGAGAATGAAATGAAYTCPAAAAAAELRLMRTDSSPSFISISSMFDSSSSSISFLTLRISMVFLLIRSLNVCLVANAFYCRALVVSAGVLRSVFNSGDGSLQSQ